jgi:hypothetical protein
MARIPDQTIVPKVESRVQGDTELDHAQVRREVRAAFRDQIAEGIADLSGQLVQFTSFHLLEVGGRIKL